MSERIHHPESISYAIEGDWLHCPNCGSNQVTGSPVEIVGMLAVQPVNCDHCNTGWTEEYTASRRTGIEWDEEWAEFGIAADTLKDQGFAPSLEHTGGGVLVLYVRTALNDINVATYQPGAEIAFPVSHPFIGITRSEDHPWAEGMWLVCGYQHDDDEGSIHGGDVVSTEGLGQYIGNLIIELREELGPLSAEDAQTWAEESLALAWETGRNALVRRNWVLERLAHGATTYRTGLAAMRWSIGQLTSGGDPRISEYCVAWSDDIGANTYRKWFEDDIAAKMFFGRLMAAVLNDAIVDDYQWYIVEVSDI